MKMAHATRSKLCELIPATVRADCNVAKNVIAPASDESPRMCNEAMPSDTELEVEKSAPVNGKYNVQPADSPVSKASAMINSATASIDSQ